MSGLKESAKISFAVLVVLAICLSGVALGDEKEEFLERFARFRVEGRESRQIQAAANDCLKFELFKEAKGLYRYILATDPGFAARLWTEVNLIKARIELWEYDAAVAAVNKLMADYAGNPDLPKAVEDIAGYLKKHGKLSEAAGLYRYAVDNTPEARRTIWAYEGLGVCSAAGGDAAACSLATTQLTTKFAADPNIAQIMTNIGHAYREAGDFTNAIKCYRYVIQNRSRASAAVWCQMGMALCHAAAGDTGQAESETQALADNFASDPGLANALYTIAKAYEKAKNYDEAKSVYQVILNVCPGGPFVDKAAVDSLCVDALAATAAGNEVAADDAVWAIVGTLGGNQYAPDGIYALSEQYLAAGNSARAAELRRMVTANWPGSIAGMQAYLATALAGVNSGNDQSVQQTIDDILANCRGEEVAKSLTIIAEEYYKRVLEAKKADRKTDADDLYDKAAAIWQRSIDDAPPSRSKAHAWYWLGNYYGMKGQYAVALDHYQKVIADWRDFMYGWSAMLFIGKCYQRMGESGQMAAAYANLEAEKAFKIVEYGFADTEGYARALGELGSLYFRKGQWRSGADYYQRYLAQLPENKTPPIALYRYAKCLERSGQRPAAIEVYGQFLAKADPESMQYKAVRRRFPEL